jgi:hypothetical protein
MRESACHCEGWRRLQKAEAKKGFIMHVAAGIVLEKKKKKKKTSDLFARVFYGKAEWSTEERISKDYLLCKIKIKLKKYVRKISMDSQGGRTSNLSMGLISSINAGRGLC